MGPPVVMEPDLIRSPGFLGVRTEAFDATVGPDRDVLRPEPIVAGPGVAWFRAGDETAIHVAPEDLATDRPAGEPAGPRPARPWLARP
jgi:hypothetical protein